MNLTISEGEQQRIQQIPRVDFTNEVINTIYKSETLMLFVELLILWNR